MGGGEEGDLGENDVTDTVEAEDAAQLYDGGIERGNGTIRLSPENCQNIIEEPARSISEVRTIVSGKDRLDTLTYVNNEYGWVNPVTGEVGDIDEVNPVEVNIMGYPQVLGDVTTDGAGAQPPTMDQPVYTRIRPN